MRTLLLVVLMLSSSTAFGQFRGRGEPPHTPLGATYTGPGQWIWPDQMAQAQQRQPGFIPPPAPSPAPTQKGFIPKPITPSEAQADFDTNVYPTAYAKIILDLNSALKESSGISEYRKYVNYNYITELEEAYKNAGWRIVKFERFESAEPENYYKMHAYKITITNNKPRPLPEPKK